MADVGGGDDGIRCAERQRLGRENHIGINGIIGCGGLPLAARLRLQFGGAAHGSGGYRQVFGGSRQGIESGDARFLPSTKQFTPQFVIGDLRDNDALPRSEQANEPAVTCLGIEPSWRGGQKTERSRVQ